MSGVVAIVDRILAFVLPPGAASEAIRGDLSQEYRDRRARGTVRAGAWYAAQAVSVVLWAVSDRVRGRTWRGREEEPRPGARLIEPSAMVRDGLRVFRRDPGYAASVVVTLGLALATTITVFTAVRGVLLHDLPYPDGERIVRIDRVTDGVIGNGGVSYPDYLEWAAGISSYEAMLAHSGWEGTYIADGVAELWDGITITPGFLDVFGVRPAAGRGLDETNAQPGMRSIMISFDLWQRRFGADPSIGGRSITIDEEPWTIVGVLPEGFEYPDAHVDAIAPLADGSYLESRGAGFLEVLARVSPDATTEAARAETDALVAAIDAEFNENREGVAVRSYADTKVAPVRRMLGLFMLAVTLVLVVACANVSGLSLARTEGRRGELSVRRALGAGRGRVVRQLLAESVVVAVVGGALGLALSFAGVRLLLALAPPDLPRRELIAIDPVVASFALAAAVGAGVLFGALPALRGASAPTTSTLRGGRTVAGRASRTQEWLAGAQIALAVVLLSAASLLVRSSGALDAVDPGFDAADRLVVEVGLPPSRYSSADETLGFHRRLLEGVRGLPGVVDAGLSTHLPFGRGYLQAVMLKQDQPFIRGEVPVIGLEMYSGEYFRALGLPVLRGRAASLDLEQPRQVVLNEAAAEELFPGEDALGRRVSFDVEEGQPSPDSTMYTVVGIVPSVRSQSLTDDLGSVAYYYLPDIRRQYSFSSGRAFRLVVHTEGDPLSLATPVRELLLDLDPALPVRDIQTMEALVRRTTLAPRFRSSVVAVFSLLALGVAFVGVYAVMAYGVSRGRREIGIRMALGASTTGVRRGVLTRASRVVVLGAGLGVGTAWMAGPVLADFLFETSPRDLGSLGTVLLVAIVGSLVAAWVPAARASSVDPARVLRDE